MKLAGLVNQPDDPEPADGFRSSPDATRRCVRGSRIDSPANRDAATNVLPLAMERGVAVLATILVSRARIRP
jgi:hypothetical protein